MFRVSHGQTTAALEENAFFHVLKKNHKMNAVMNSSLSVVSVSSAVRSHGCFLVLHVAKFKDMQLQHYREKNKTTCKV